MISRQKKVELRIIRGFLRFGGHLFFRVIPHEKPDAIATLHKDGKRWKVGIEQTEYHVDASRGKGSPGRRINDVWSYVRASINRRISHRPNFTHTSGTVFLRNASALTKLASRALASELVKVASEFPVTPQGEQTITKFSSSYPLLNRHVRKVILRGTGYACKVNWACGDAISSTIGLSEKTITYIIQQKGIESRQYSWNQVAERWLLESASGGTVFNSAGPLPQSVEWSSQKLTSACKSAGFDHIFFWDRMYNWYKEVWPGAPVVQKNWRSTELRGSYVEY